MKCRKNGAQTLNPLSSFGIAHSKDTTIQGVWVGHVSSCFVVSCAHASGMLWCVGLSLPTPWSSDETPTAGETCL